MQKKRYDLIIIGGGAAGMFMSIVAASKGLNILLIEKNQRLGVKLSITGGQRCNITNNLLNPHEFIEVFGEKKKFLFSPFSQFSVPDTFRFFKELGIDIVVQEKNRCFPKSEQAQDVVDTLAHKIQHYTRSKHITVMYQTKVIKLITKNNSIQAVRTLCDGKEQEFKGDFVALATGGMAMPETGSSGDGFRFLSLMGHAVKQPSPNIVPLKSSVPWLKHLAGTVLHKVKITFKNTSTHANGTTFPKIKVQGDLLFTHQGISGPTVLNNSFKVKELLSREEVEASIDCFPQHNEKELDRYLIQTIEPRKKVYNSLRTILPKQLLTVLQEFCNIEGFDEQGGQFTKVNRHKLVMQLKNFTLPITGTMGFHKAVIADGGLNLKEVDTKRMSSRLFTNLYVLGDILDINRPSGGFSLQLCWTTAWVAGQDCAKRVHAKSTQIYYGK